MNYKILISSNTISFLTGSFFVSCLVIAKTQTLELQGFEPFALCFTLGGLAGILIAFAGVFILQSVSTGKNINNNLPTQEGNHEWI